jgi:hypothetical protein
MLKSDKMADNSLVLSADNIKRKIHTIRNMQVILDADLAEFYNVETKVLNQAVKRNSERFPEKFMFQLTKNEFENLKSQFVTSSWGGRRNIPYAFTEQSKAAGFVRNLSSSLSCPSLRAHSSCEAQSQNLKLFLLS